MMGFIKKKRKGYILINSVLAMIVLMMVSTGLLTIFSSQFSMAQAGRTALQAQQYAEIATNTLQLLSYDKLDSGAHARKNITDAAGWEDEIVIGPEKTIDNSKQRIATVKIYKTGDTLARYSLQVPLSSQGSSNGSVPIGTVIAWPLLVDPDGVDQGKWLECDGRIINASKFPKLAALISHTPDYRGIFLRGIGVVTSNHYNTVIHQSAPLGELQGDAIRNITGGFRNVDNEFSESSYGAFYSANQHYGPGGRNDDLADQLYFDASRVVPVDNEIRPINRAVRYLIRAA